MGRDGAGSLGGATECGSLGAPSAGTIHGGSKPYVINYTDGKLELSAAEFQLYSQLFTVLDSDGDEEIPGKEGAAFLRRARMLDDDVLRVIYRLACGGNSKATLNREEWFLACKFVGLVQHFSHSSSNSALNSASTQTTNSTSNSVLGLETKSDSPVSGSPPVAVSHAQSHAALTLSRECLFRNDIKIGLADFGLFGKAPDYTTDVSPAHPPSTCQIRVFNPTVAGSGMKRHVIYTVSLRTTLPHFPRQQQLVHVTRRYSDFRWLHERLCARFPGTVIPPLPATRMFGNLSAAFIEERRLALQQYLDEVARHPKLTQCFEVQAILDASSEGFDVCRLMMDAADGFSGNAALQLGAPSSSSPSPSLVSAKFPGAVNSSSSGMTSANGSGLMHVSSDDLPWDDDADFIDAQGDMAGAGKRASEIAGAAGAAAGAAAAAASSWFSSIVKKVEHSSLLSGLEEATGATPGTNSTPQMETHVRRELVRLGIRTDTVDGFRQELADYGKRLHAAIKVIDKLVACRRARGYELARIGAYFGSLAKVEALCTDSTRGLQSQQAHPQQQEQQQLRACLSPDQALFEDLYARFDQSSNHVQDLNDRVATGLLAPLRYQMGKIGAMNTVIENHDSRVYALRRSHEALESAKKHYASARAQSTGVDTAQTGVRTAEQDILDAERTLVEMHSSVNLEMQKFSFERAQDVTLILQTFATAEIQGAHETQQMLAPLQQLCSDNLDNVLVQQSFDRIFNSSRGGAAMSISASTDLPAWFLEKASLAPSSF
mmetsp:Transcript_4405/g.9515  ORF Transcript_4405/g.9515 Transcript_4405/m.9515 type:complete len:774 (+) Transcript_4405:225-2546(+)|eukprot:CAMPEP_0171487470 /NCGR_PEP_ID=MMETSP0958-20121227/1668_1 /TAXON_ID=87120 /ORGANISM="Aurantiochytrium limacinum, Strain ATCCMYA-1381" /LENGTH=773 /DNA_ID=CAMNT_0012020473 /DNA_START=145 /DNA_END=2466 /DNA_ORIENTATION=+